MRCTVPLLLLFGICAAQTDSPIDLKKDFVLTETEAVGLLPPKVVCDFAFSQMAWSADGRYILILRSDPKLNVGIVRSGIVQRDVPKPAPEQSLVIVDVQKGTSQPVWSTREAPVIVSQMAWIRGTTTATFVLTTNAPEPNSEQSKLYTVSAEGGKAQLALAGEPDEMLEVNLSPLTSRGFVTLEKPRRPSTGGEVVRAIRMAELYGNGRIGRIGAMPETLVWGASGWTADGTRVLFFVNGRQGDEEYVFDFAAWKEQIVSGVEFYKPLKPDNDVVVDMRQATVQVGERSDVVPVAWLMSKIKTKRQSALIGVNARAVMSPNNDAVLYVQQGVTLVRPLVRVPRAAFEAALSDDEKKRLINEAKQCATAMMIYSADYDDAFPLSGDISDSVDPYLKNRSLLENFVYTFGGGLLGDRDASKTELGYKLGEFGRAVAYADGSVRWFPNK